MLALKNSEIKINEFVFIYNFMNFLLRVYSKSRGTQ